MLKSQRCAIYHTCKPSFCYLDFHYFCVVLDDDDMILPLVCFVAESFENCAAFFAIILGVGPFNCQNYRTGDQRGQELRPCAFCVVPFNQI